jgi:hypothetical protein
MIHDERKVPVFDLVSRRTVGSLDESFVVGWAHTGAVFVTVNNAPVRASVDDANFYVQWIDNLLTKRRRGEIGTHFPDETFGWLQGKLLGRCVPSSWCC